MTTAAAPATSPSVGPSDTVLLPGQPIGAEYLRDPKPTVGKGCYEYKGRLLASIIGRARREGQIVSVIGKQEAGVVPDVDSIIIGTITRLTPQQAHMTISIVDDRVVQEGGGEEFGGVIRIADIRLTERDKVKIADCFRLGDVVKARVLSLGDARSYYLSTAANELGVVYAVSEHGNALLPVSYQEMEDAVTGKLERRKVAKPEGV